MDVLRALAVKIFEFQESNKAGFRHFENRSIAIYPQPPTAFDEIWHDDAYWSSEPNVTLKFLIFEKCYMVYSRNLENRKHCFKIVCNYRVTHYTNFAIKRQM